jgi:hypothetical protein
VEGAFNSDGTRYPLPTSPRGTYEEGDRSESVELGVPIGVLGVPMTSGWELLILLGVRSASDSIVEPCEGS